MTGILFPIGFVALVRTGSPDRPIPFDRRSPSPRPLARHLGIHGLKAGAGKNLEKSEKRAVQAARNGPSEDRPYWQRVEPDIHSLNRWPVKCLEMSRKRRVQAARNGPSPPPTPAGGPVAKAEMSTADRLGSRERAAGATHFAAPMSACTRSTSTRTERALKEEACTRRALRRR